VHALSIVHVAIVKPRFQTEDRIANEWLRAVWCQAPTVKWQKRFFNRRYFLTRAFRWFSRRSEIFGRIRPCNIPRKDQENYKRDAVVFQ